VLVIFGYQAKGCQNKQYKRQNMWGPRGQGGKKSTSSSSSLLLSRETQQQEPNHSKKFENSNSHQISQTKIQFCLVSRTDHETMIRFHIGGLYREKSEPQL